MQRSSDSGAHAELHAILRTAQAADGGWPYYKMHRSRLEPTCWALLAIAARASEGDREVVERGRAFLRQLRQERGLLVEAGMPGPNAAWNGLALLTDMSLEAGVGSAWRQGIAEGLLAARGIALEEQAAPVRQNNRLQAWSWIDGTFSWIEPTALCLLAIKKMTASTALARTRIAEAEAVILDRACEAGGWNYGNAEVLGQDLRPYVPTTALALLAMQDRRTHPAVASSVNWLKAHAGAERSAMALSLSIICLVVVGDRAQVPWELLVQQPARTAFLGNLHLTAMALYALTAPQHMARAFRLS